MHPSSLLFLFFVAVLIIVAVVRVLFSEEAKIKRALRAARKVEIRDAKQGDVVKLVGRVRLLQEPLRGPLSRRPCAFYEVVVEQYRSSGKSGSWHTIIHEVEARDFLLEDGTGRALVDTSKMKVVAVKDTERESGTWNDASPDLEAYLARHGEKSVGWVFNKKLRYREGVFAPGEVVCVLGRARWERDPDPSEAGSGYRDGPKRLVVEARADGPLLASDEPTVA